MCDGATLNISPDDDDDDAQMANFCALYFSEPRAAHFKPAF